MPISVMEPPAPRVPAQGEAEGFGASYCRERKRWVVYWMPRSIPLGVEAESQEACEVVVAALRLSISKEPK